MFLKYYSLAEDPFGATPNPKFLYFGREHREALSSLYHGILNGRGFTVLIAPPGMGKTTLLHCLCEKIQGWADTAFLFSSFDDRKELLHAVMAALSVEAEDGPYSHWFVRFDRYVKERQALGRKVVLIFDEAQNLSYDALENIRVLSNLETKEAKLVQIVLAGQPPLVRKLNGPEMEQLGQRISVFSRILPLDEAEVEPYLRHRLRVAGCEELLFTPDAVAVIARHSRGVPRNINSLCYETLALGWVLGRPQINGELVEQAVRDLKLPEVDTDGRRFSIHGDPLDASNGDGKGKAAQLVQILRSLGAVAEQLQKLSQAQAPFSKREDRVKTL